MSVCFNVGPQIVLKYKVFYVMESWKWRNTFKTQSWKAPQFSLLTTFTVKTVLFSVFFDIWKEKKSKKWMR